MFAQLKKGIYHLKPIMNNGNNCFRFQDYLKMGEYFWSTHKEVKFLFDVWLTLSAS